MATDAESWEQPSYTEFFCGQCGEGLRMIPHGDPGALTGVCKEHGWMVFIYFPVGTPVSTMTADGTFHTSHRPPDGKKRGA